MCKIVETNIDLPARPSDRHFVGPFRLSIFGSIDVLLDTAWPVLALVFQEKEPQCLVAVAVSVAAAVM